MNRRRHAVVLAALLATSLAAPAAAGSWHLTTLPAPAHGPFSFAEPGVAIGPDSEILVDGASANTGAPPTFWLSRDGGGSWTAGQDFDQSGASSGDADGAIGPDGYLYALDLGYNPNPPGQPANPTVLLYRSANGSSWSGPASFPPPHGADQPDRPWLVIDPRQPAHVDVLNSEGAGNIVIWRSLDHGAHFTGPAPVTGGPNTQAGLALSSRPLFDPTRADRMFMLYELGASAAGLWPLFSGSPPYEFPLTQLWLATSLDGGQTWSNRLVLDTAKLAGSLRNGTLGHLLVASAIDAAGNLYAAFSLREPDATQTAIYLIHSGDHGATWSAPVEVPAPSLSNVMPALGMTPAGVAYLSWYGSPSPDFRDSSARWAEMFASYQDPLSGHPSFAVGQVSGSAPVHVGGINTAGTTGSDLGADWGLRDFQSIAVDACGRPHLVWADDNGTQATQTAYPALPACGNPSPRRLRRRRHRHPTSARRRSSSRRSASSRTSSSARS